MVKKLKKHRKLIAAVVVVALVVGSFVAWRHFKKTPSPVDVSNAIANKIVPAPAAAPATTFNKQQYSLDDPASLWVVVNKQRQLKPLDYVPSGLVAPSVTLRLSAGTDEMKMRPDSGAALKTMFAAAQTAGYKMMLVSGYRSEPSQKALHDQYVAQQGQTAADASSARAGYSEHQTGLAVDVGRADHKCEVDQCFADTPEGQWVAANSYKYGFIVRYLKDKQPITGYEYEPWHLRYVGVDLATQIHQSGQTMEEFFGLPAAPDYN